MKKCVVCYAVKPDDEFTSENIDDENKCRYCIKFKELTDLYRDETRKESDTREYSEFNLEYIREYERRRKYIGIELGKEMYRRGYKVDRQSRPAKFKKYASRLTIEESPILGEFGEILVRCRKCGGYFVPTNGQIEARIRCINGKASGESSLYCSQACKDSCEVYNVRYDPYAHHASVERDPAWARRIKKAAKYMCERCGSKENLEAHHEIPVKVDQSLVNDETNGICLCHDCHMKAHSESGCTLADLRKI